jgi:aminomethyltransferase
MTTTPVTTPKRTALYSQHVQAGAKMVDFAGWEMPIQYGGITKEHEAVRSSAGLFDLSHMGEVYVDGEGAEAYLQGLFTNDLSKIEEGKAQYGCMCNEQGRVLDDMIIYRLGGRFLVVMNASNREKIVAWMQKHLPAGVTLDDQSLQVSLVAIQGPKAQEILQKHANIDLESIKYYACAPGSVCGVDCLVSRTGYTGEDGFELYLPWDEAATVWETLVALPEVEPIGLGARDTLRLESGYALYGHELSEDITPLDASLGWVVKLDKPFIGRDALKAYKESGVRNCLIGIEMEGRTIPREGYPVHSGGRVVGRVTSGTFSPSLKRGIALASVETAVRAEGTSLEVEIRGRHERAKPARPPFVKGSVRRA